MTAKIFIGVVIVLLVALLFFSSNYINTETIKMVSISGETINDISKEIKNEEYDLNIINNEAEFEERVLKSNKKVLVDFYADWCGPCQIMSPILDEFVSTHPEILYYKVNVDYNEELCTKYGILYIPTLMVFEGGEAKNSTTGVVEVPTLEDLIK